MVKWIGERISTEDHEKATTVVILPKRVKWKEVLLVLWVIGFSFAGFYMIYLLFFGGISDLAVGENFDQEIREQQKIYLMIFIAFWAYFEFLTVRTTLWYIFGKELLMIDSEALSVKKSIFGYGKANRYFFENIKKLRFEKADPTSLNNYLSNAYWSVGTENIKFEYMGKTKSFGRRVEQKEAILLTRFIQNRIKKWRKN
ncbi:MAG: hypothetical protein WDZ35_04140 [Crocinitomicaceae bacterium]